MELPDDWFVDHDGQSVVLDPAKVVAEIERLHTALRRINSLDKKNVPKYAQQIAREVLNDPSPP